MSLEISWVRPPIFPLTASRSERSWVALGNMAYSAVTQPSPESFLKRGTPGVNDALHKTLVFPKETNTEPSAWMVKFRSILTSRSSCSALPFGLVICCLSFQVGYIVYLWAQKALGQALEFFGIASCVELVTGLGCAGGKHVVLS